MTVHITRPYRALAAGLVLAGLLGACGGTAQRPAEWAAAHATPVASADPAAPLDDIAPALRAAVGEAAVVGLGESVHGAAQQLTLKHRALKVLVEQLGFRTVAWEEDWTTGQQINTYIATGDGDPDELVRRMSPQWQLRQVTDVLIWLREFNRDRPDPVQFVGVEYYLTGQAAYDTIDQHVAGVAPSRLAELRDHLQAIRPASANVFDHIQTVAAAPDKQPYLRHARAVHDLLGQLPHPPDDRAHALVEHTARQIVSFYEALALPTAESHSFRDARAAENLTWWHDLVGGKIAYWAASPHIANAPQLRIAAPDGTELRFASAGSHLRTRYGDRYLSIGTTFDHGSASSGGEEATQLSESPDPWFEAPLGEVQHDLFLLDLRAPAPPDVAEWLNSPVTTRGPMGPGSTVDGGTARQWFDAIIHIQQVTPADGAGS